MIISQTWLKKLKLKPTAFYDTVNSFENQNSVRKIKGNYKDELSFEFKQFTTNQQLKIMKKLPSNKASNPSIPKRWCHRQGKLYTYKYVIKHFQNLWKINL